MTVPRPTSRPHENFDRRRGEYAHACAVTSGLAASHSPLFYCPFSRRAAMQTRRAGPFGELPAASWRRQWQPMSRNDAAELKVPEELNRQRILNQLEMFYAGDLEGALARV